MDPFRTLLILLYCFLQFIKCLIAQTETGVITQSNFGYEDDKQTVFRRNESNYNYLDEDATEPNIENLQKSTNEVVPTQPSAPVQKRREKMLFSKIHSGASFLAGLKLGKILSKKGFELGHGKIASSHTFQLFGKTVNSATSLAYGDTIPFLPALDEESSPDAGASSSKTGPLKKETYRVTVIESLSNDTDQKFNPVYDDVVEDRQEKLDIDDEKDDERKKHVIKLYQENAKNENDFIKGHNAIVKEINKNAMRRINSKF